MHDIICAISTSPGESAIGIIRLTGLGCCDLVSNFFINSNDLRLNELPARYMHYGHIVNNSKIIDEVMVVYYQSPKTYTREEMVEIFAHGSYISLLEIQKLMIQSGATPAEPGEFTKRAFLNGRIDLSQAEAVMELISSKTKVGFDVALSHLEGSLANHINQISDRLTDMMAQIEVVIDYPDDDVEIITTNNIKDGLLDIREALSELSTSYQSGKIIREGLSIAIIGRPNVGKSSLLNALLKENRAIVTDIAGTTRDVIEESANIKGIPIKLIDTAGIRETEDTIEKIGVERSKHSFNQSDLALVVLNASELISQEDINILSIVADKKVIVVINKVDLTQSVDLSVIKESLPDTPILFTSALNGVGLDLLENQIEKMVLSGNIHQKSGTLITNMRHFNAVVKAIEQIDSAITSLEADMPLDLVEVDIVSAYQSLGEITGQTVNEDVVNRIFEKFCLGK